MLLDHVLNLRPEEIGHFLRSHGLGGERVVRFALDGSVNCVWMTEEFVVRVLKAPDFASDVYTETVAVPAVRAAGAWVPELVVFDDSRSMIDSVVSVYRRIPGDPLGHFTGSLDEAVFYRDLGRQIGLFHRGVREVADPKGYLDRPKRDDPYASLARQSARIPTGAAMWAEQALGRMDLAAAAERPDVFVHWDLHAMNLMVDGGRLAAILDWGDAGWGHPAISFHCLPGGNLPELLEGYGESDPALVGSILSTMLGYALNDAHEPPNADQPYRNHGMRRWESLYVLAGRPGAWQDFLAGMPELRA